jgi:hypothetical protein
VHLLHHNIYPSPTLLPLVYLTVDRNLEDLIDIEELRHMMFQVSKGTREVKDIIQDDFSSSYTKPLQLWEVNIGINEHPKLAPFNF